MKIFPVIMSGGSGTRLWPLSTDQKPKQFHGFLGSRPMIVETASRFAGTDEQTRFLDPILIANAAHADLIAYQLKEHGITPAAVILEPMGRNTAATAAIAALAAREIDPDAAVLLMPADHVVTKPQAFLDAILKAAPVLNDRVVTFGIEPNAPETGYGYIKQGAALRPGVFAIESFKEKPDAEVAAAYLAEGGYTWNSGVFFFKPSVMLEEFDTSAPDIAAGAANALKAARRNGATLVLDAHAFAMVRSAPIDIAVMEKTTRAAVAPCDIGWADIGSWAELWRLSEKDENDNAGAGKLAMLDSRGNLVMASEGMRVAIAGVEDLIVVATKDAVLVLPRSRAQDVKKLLDGLKD
jgi:mannose-1-phosphate guanylyltransferase/mannose-6-phosphate isomerase